MEVRILLLGDSCGSQIASTVREVSQESRVEGVHKISYLVNTSEC